MKSACRGVDIGVFIDADEGPLREDYSVAEALCAVCPVTGECHKDAIAKRDVWAYRAGMTPLERVAAIDPDYVPAARDESHRDRLERRKLQRMRDCWQISPPPGRHIRRVG